MTNFALDRPQVIEDPIESTALYRLGNQDVSFHADARANLTNLFWPWASTDTVDADSVNSGIVDSDSAGGIYAKSISVTISAPREDALVPMVSHLYPGNMETILGTHSMDGGIIVSKQLAVPLGSSYDRSAIWLLSCQAEGDRLLQVDVDIDWGEALEQQMVDGLLLAQKNPGSPQGIYEQRNADSTRVFGNPEGRPHQVELDDPQRARLVYYVLVNGEVDFQFLLTVSDVGEQVAWNGFLALRDATRVVEKSGNAWRDYLNAGRLWTPDPTINNLINASKIAAIQSLQRLRSGMTPAGRLIKDAPALINAWDIFDPIQSRNLLAHMRRLAEKTTGRLPERLPLRRKDNPDDPGSALLQTNEAYLLALASHLGHRDDAELLEQHYVAIGLCAEMLALNLPNEATNAGLGAAAYLAEIRADLTNAEKWGKAAGPGGELPPVNRPNVDLGSHIEQLKSQARWASGHDGVQHFMERHGGVAIVGEVIWRYAGLDIRNGVIMVDPAWGGGGADSWPWWALMDLPLTEETVLSLVWDGVTLHTNQPINSSLPVVQHHAIRTTGTDADSFALEFVFINKTEDNDETRKSFKPSLVL